MDQGRRVNWWKSNGSSRFTGAHWERRLDRRVWSHRTHKESQLHMGLCSGRLVRVPMQKKGLTMDHWSMEKGVLGLMNHWFFLNTKMTKCLHHTCGRDGTRIHFEKKASWQRIWPPGIHVDFTLTHTTYLNVVADQVYLFMAAVFSRIMCPFSMLKLHRNGLKNISKMLVWPLYLNLIERM